MKKFVLKLLKFLLIPIFVFVFIDLLINELSKEKGLNELIESKVKALPVNNDQFNIIIAGDSRAERQLIPQVFKEVTGYNTINIAVSNGELVTVVETIKKHYLNTNFILIVSASSFQTNDGAVDTGYLSKSCFQKVSLLNKFRLYNGDIISVLKMYKSLIKEVVLSFTNDYEKCEKELVRKNGFLGVAGRFEELDSQARIKEYVKLHKHYKNLNNKGIRWGVFNESFNELSNLGINTILIQPPLSPYGKKITVNTKIQRAEVMFSKRLDSLTRDKRNIRVHDFYSKEIVSLPDSLFYDFYHLNVNGAKIFSNKVAELINEMIAKENKR